MQSRLNQYFQKYSEEYMFLELMPDYIKRERIDFMRGVPIPVKKGAITDLTGQQGIEFKYFMMGMINMIGIDPSFEYTSKYVKLLQHINRSIETIIMDVGIGLGEAQHLDEACITFRAAVVMNPDNMDALYNYMLICRNMYAASDDSKYIADFKQESYETLLHMREVDPNFDKTYYYLGYAYANAGRYSMAKREWEIFLEKTRPGDEYNEIRMRLQEIKEAVRIERGYSDVMQGEWDSGLAILEEYKDTDLMEWWPLPYYLGVAYNRMERYSEALEMLRRAVKGNPSSPEIAAELVMTHEGLGDEVNAQKYRRKMEILNGSVTADHWNQEPDE